MTRAQELFIMRLNEQIKTASPIMKKHLEEYVELIKRIIKHRRNDEGTIENVRRT